MLKHYDDQQQTRVKQEGKNRRANDNIWVTLEKQVPRTETVIEIKPSTCYLQLVHFMHSNSLSDQLIKRCS